MPTCNSPAAILNGRGDCLKCTACYHNCPQGAVRYRKARSRYCFRNPAVTLQDIIHANNLTR